MDVIAGPFKSRADVQPFDDNDAIKPAGFCWPQYKHAYMVIGPGGRLRFPGAIGAPSSGGLISGCDPGQKVFLHHICVRNMCGSAKPPVMIAPRDRTFDTRKERRFLRWRLLS